MTDKREVNHEKKLVRVISIKSISIPSIQVANVLKRKTHVPCTVHCWLRAGKWLWLGAAHYLTEIMSHNM